MALPSDVVFDASWSEGDDYPDSSPERVPLASLAGVTTHQRFITVTPLMVKAAQVPAGTYEHVGETADGAWIYAPLDGD